jgi:hypothetical protein
MAEEQSKKYQLNAVDGKKILKGFLIGMGGAALTFLLDLLPQVDFQGYEAIVIPIASTGINFLLKLLSGKK